MLEYKVNTPENINVSFLYPFASQLWGEYKVNTPENIDVSKLAFWGYIYMEVFKC